jgi:hypothetical protein
LGYYFKVGFTLKLRGVFIPYLIMVIHPPDPLPPDFIGIKGVRYIEVDIITILFRLKRVKSG